MWILFFLSSHFLPSFFIIFDVFGVIHKKKSSNLSTSPPHLTPWNTYFCSCAPPFSTVHHITVWLGGRVSSLLFPPPLPFLVKERMRLEREEATRQLEEETEVRFFSQGGVLTTFLPANGSQNTSVTSSFFLNAVIKAVWSWSHLLIAVTVLIYSVFGT